SVGKTTFVHIDEIDWLEAAENYVELHAGNSRHLIHVPMKTLEESLNPEHFVRIHRSIIVNISRIKELQTAMHGEYLVILYNGVPLQSGRAFNAKLKALAANPF